MHALKDKVADRISRLFSPSPAPVDGSQGRSYSAVGKSPSSIFSYIVPSPKAEKLKPDKYDDDIKPIQSEPVRWNSKIFEWREEPFHSCVGVHGDQNRETTYSQNNNTDQPSRIGTSGSDVFEEAPDPHSPVKSMPDLTEESSFLSPDLYEFLHSCIPNIVKGCQWVLLYSTLKHGISLRTLIRKSADHSGPCLLIVGDLQGAVFGGLLECPLTPTVKRKYQGKIQTFVFTTIYGEPRLFRPTGANRYFYLCLNDLLALGGGGNFALRLDGDLLNGASGPCDTFGNLCLAHTPEFELKNVEVLGNSALERRIRLVSIQTSD